MSDRYTNKGSWLLLGERHLARFYFVEDARKYAATLNAQGGVVDDEEAVEGAARAIYAECWPLPDDAPFDAACASERESAYKLARAALAAVKGETP